MKGTFDGEFLEQVSTALDEDHAVLHDLGPHEVHFPRDGAEGCDGVQ